MLLHEIASHSSMDSLELASALRRNDPDPEVQAQAPPTDLRRLLSWFFGSAPLVSGWHYDKSSCPEEENAQCVG
jgi:streptomycin 6-kinase